jgi:hypothetical protein
MIPPPQIEEHAGIVVVRDDLIRGGTKRRVIGQFLTGGRRVCVCVAGLRIRPGGARLRLC